MEDLNAPNLHLIRGPELLTSISGLTVDMLHPGDYGMIEIAENLASRMGTIVSGLRRGGRPFQSPQVQEVT